MADESKIISDVSASVDKLTGSFTALSGVITGNLEQQKKLIQYIGELKKSLSGDEFKNFAKVQGELVKVQDALSKKQKEALDLTVREEKIKQQAIKTQEAAVRAANAEVIAKEKQRVATANAEKAELSLKTAKEKAVNASKAAKGAYERESTKLRELTVAAKNAAVSYGVNSKEARKLAAEQQKLDKKIKAVDASLGIHNRNVGNYTSALGGATGKLLGAFGLVGGIQMFARVMKDAFNIARDYEKKNAELAGVLGKTRKETVKLQKESKRLGATTAFTSKQVTELQVELARMGKSESEIIGMTQGVINATIAMGSETGETAALVAATLNAFKLEAKDSAHVADVLTLSTQRSAL